MLALVWVRVTRAAEYDLFSFVVQLVTPQSITLIYYCD
jgi:hypothetical protein